MPIFTYFFVILSKIKTIALKNGELKLISNIVKSS